MKILFLCVANSARSQIAEGLAKKLLGPSHEIHSAGSDPVKAVNPLAISVLSEINIDISGNKPKHWGDLSSEFIKGLDSIITLCEEEVCPTLPVNSERLHWGLLDPAAVKGSENEKLEAFRKTRDEIERRLMEFKLSPKVDKSRK